MGNGLLPLIVMLSAAAGAAERKFDFGQFHENEIPPGFRSAVTGQGKPGDWKIVMDEAPSAAGETASPAKRAVLSLRPGWLTDRFITGAA